MASITVTEGGTVSGGTTGTGGGFLDACGAVACGGSGAGFGEAASSAHKAPPPATAAEISMKVVTILMARMRFPPGYALLSALKNAGRCLSAPTRSRPESAPWCAAPPATHPRHAGAAADRRRIP